MFKKLIFTMLAVAALSIPAQAETEAIAGFTGGYAYNGPATGQPWFAGVTGLRVKTFNDGWTKLYTVARYAGTETEAQWGAKAIIAQKVTTNGRLWWLVDAGALDGGFANADGTEEMTPTIGTGPAVSVNKFMSVALYGEGWRAASDQWGMAVSLAVTIHMFTDL
jgi:hypothetical protein